MEQIDQFEVEVESIKRSVDGHGGFEIHAFAPSNIARHELPSVFFRMCNYTLAPCIGERITITVERLTCPATTTDAVPETTDTTEHPVPEAVRRRFREEASADFGAGTQENQREYQRLYAEWQEKHPRRGDPRRPIEALAPGQ